ncbi:MAG: hypothetical protein CL875_01595 [Dehalococcoidales bacterium]|jgi:Xaa-Pro aminopeptidase|nr:hypothetical protein [Dehalococcoidales bacterium]|tara:strand:+ start:463 stop:864 length:402 start_codon:yes stop_codon:yes gene_type:complete
MGRTFSVGQPGDLQKKIYTALKAGLEQGLSRVKPGVKMKEIYRVIQETVNRSGLKWCARQNMGHMLGIGPGNSQETPMISPDEETELKPNMVMCIENGAYLGRVGAFQLEEEVVVTPDGYKLLTKLPRDMIEL